MQGQQQRARRASLGDHGGVFFLQVGHALSNTGEFLRNPLPGGDRGGVFRPGDESVAAPTSVPLLRELARVSHGPYLVRAPVGNTR
jgi:hypothetical protein